MSSSTKPKGSRSRTKEQRGTQTKKGSNLQPPKSPKKHKTSQSVEYHCTKSPKSTLKAPLKKHQRSNSINVKKTAKSENVKIIESKCIVRCELCRHDAYRRKMKKKNPNWTPFQHSTMKEFKRHLKSAHSKRKVQNGYYSVIGEIDDIGNRHYLIIRAGGQQTTKCTYSLNEFLCTVRMRIVHCVYTQYPATSILSKHAVVTHRKRTGILCHFYIEMYSLSIDLGASVITRTSSVNLKRVHGITAISKTKPK